jgi:hypothetical protein
MRAVDRQGERYAGAEALQSERRQGIGHGKGHEGRCEGGSLGHTKWVWGVLEKWPKASETKTTLAELLMEQLPGGLCPTEGDDA